MKPMVFLICLLFLLTCSTAYGGDSLTQGLSGIAGNIQKDLAPIGKIPNMVVERFNGAANSITGMINGALAPAAAAAKNEPEKPIIYLSKIVFRDQVDIARAGGGGGIYKNGSVIINSPEGGDYWDSSSAKTNVIQGTLKNDIITMDNGDRGMLNKSSDVVVIGANTYYKD